MKKTLETYSEIETHLDRSIELLNGLKQTEDAKALQHIQKKYRDLINDWMVEENLAKIKFTHSRSIGIEYFKLGEKDENKH